MECFQCGSQIQDGEQHVEVWLRGVILSGFPTVTDVVSLPSCVCCLESRTREVNLPWKENYDRLTKQLEQVHTPT